MVYPQGLGDINAEVLQNKPDGFHTKTMNYVLQVAEFSLKVMDFVLKMMNFVGRG